MGSWQNKPCWVDVELYIPVCEELTILHHAFITLYVGNCQLFLMSVLIDDPLTFDSRDLLNTKIPVTDLLILHFLRPQQTPTVEGQRFTNQNHFPAPKNTPL